MSVNDLLALVLVSIFVFTMWCLMRYRHKQHLWLGIPTWLLTSMLTPFLPKEHAWKNARFSLKQWHKGETQFCRDLDIHLYNGAFTLIVIIVRDYI